LTRRRTGGEGEARPSPFAVLSNDAKQRIPHLKGFLSRVFNFHSAREHNITSRISLGDKNPL